LLQEELRLRLLAFEALHDDGRYEASNQEQQAEYGLVNQDSPNLQSVFK
jgi:hypothetical protein